MISNEIIKVLDELCKKFGIAIDWTSQNVMPYLEQLAERFIKYKNITDTIWLIVGIVLFILSIVLLSKILKWRKSDEFDDRIYSNDSTKYLWGMSAIVCMFTISCILIILFTNGIIQNICIPELTIIDSIKFNMQ